MYKVIKQFRDNDDVIYNINDSYENQDKERIELLSTDNNKYGYPFIEKVKVTRKKKEEE